MWWIRICRDDDKIELHAEIVKWETSQRWPLSDLSLCGRRGMHVRKSSCEREQRPCVLVNCGATSTEHVDHPQHQAHGQEKDEEEDQLRTRTK